MSHGVSFTITKIFADSVVVNMHTYNFEYAEYEYEGYNKISALLHIEIVNFSNGPVGARIGPIFFRLRDTKPDY